MDYQTNNELPEVAQASKPKKSIAPYVIGIIFFVLIAGLAIWYFVFNQKTNPSSSQKQNGNQQQETSTDQNAWTFNLVKMAFAKTIDNNLLVQPALPFSTPQFIQLENLPSFSNDAKIDFSEIQKTTLEQVGFFLTDNNIIGQTPQRDDFVDMYDSFDGSDNKFNRQGDDAIFVSSDLALHLYHILIDRTFQSMEEKKFQPSLRAMTKALFLDSIKNYQTTSDQNLKDSYKRLTVYYLVPLVVLDAGSSSSQVELKPEDFDTFAQYLEAVDKQTIANNDQALTFALNSKEYAGQNLSDEIYNLAKEELTLIETAKNVGPSPLFTPLREEFVNDYSQFKPRSHYTKNDILKSYFVAMMWYGRMGFPLSSVPLTRDALIITGQINNLQVSDQTIAKMWTDMADVIDFFVGEVDDLTAYQYTGEINKIYGERLSLDQIADDNNLNKFITAAKKDLPAPRIISEILDVNDDGGQRDELLADIKQFRFMGQRFTPDAYIINNLTQGVGTPDPQTGQMLPTMPTALMPLKILSPNNKQVSKYLTAWINDPQRIEQQKRESDKIIPKILTKLQKEFDNYPTETWSKNIYWRWLDIFKTILRDYGEGYPYFMQNQAWQNKNISTSLGSFTELKHDTLLYAKQSYAERGGGGDNGDLPPVVKGYVEPDLDFWNQIINLAEISRQGLKDRNVFPEDFENKYQEFVDSTKFFQQLAQQELGNQLISDDDFEKLRTISTSLIRIVEPLPGQELTDKDKRAGIIADIHTDGVNGQILYEATGKPAIMYVAVQDINGARLTRGAVFNHYEFTDSIDERLSDEDWQDKIYLSNGTIPLADKWYSELIK